MHACFFRFSSAQGLPNLFSVWNIPTPAYAKPAKASGPGPEATIFLPKKLQTPKSYGLNTFWQVLFVLVKKSKQWKTVSNAYININIPKVLWFLVASLLERHFSSFISPCSLTESGVVMMSKLGNTELSSIVTLQTQKKAYHVIQSDLLIPELEVT